MIPAVCAVFPESVMVSESSSEVFRVLENAARLKIPVMSLSIEGRPIDADGLGALNAYLRLPRALAPGGVLPFNRLRVTRSRWDWAMFLEYLDIAAA